MKAVIIAGGLAKRLRPITETNPKAMILVRGKPLIQHLIDRLRQAGITEIIICTGYLSHAIEEYFGNGRKFGVNITYSHEEKELGTGGALKNAQALIGDDRFLVFYGDLIVEMDLVKFIDFHKNSGSEGTLTLHHTDHPYDSDMIETDNYGKIITFLGKAKPGEPVKGWGNAGVYCFEPSIFEYFPEGKSALDKEVLPKALKNGAKLYGYITSQIIKDIGTHERYEKFK